MKNLSRTSDHFGFNAAIRWRYTTTSQFSYQGSKFATLSMSRMAAPVHPPSTESAYYCSKLNDSTHLVVHRDSYQEYPLIYVKVYPQQSLSE